MSGQVVDCLELGESNPHVYNTQYEYNMYTIHNTYTYTYDVYNTHTHSRCRLFASSRTSLIGVNSWSRHGNRRRWLITSEIGNLALRRCALLSCCFARVILARVRRKHKVKMTKSITTVRCTLSKNSAAGPKGELGTPLF